MNSRLAVPCPLAVSQDVLFGIFGVCVARRKKRIKSALTRRVGVGSLVRLGRHG